MTMHLRPALAFSLFTALCLPSTGFAQDVPPAAAALLKSWEIQYKMAPTYKSISTDSNGAVTIENLEWKVAPGTDPSVKATVDSVELEDIADEGSGLYSIGDVTYTGMKIDFAGVDGTSFSISTPEVAIEDMYVKAVGDNPSPADTLRAGMNVAKKSAWGKITVNAGGQSVSADGLTTTWDGDPVTGSGKSNMKLSNIFIPETLMAMADQSGMIKGLGYSTLSIDIGADIDLTNDGKNLAMNFGTYYAVKDVGTLHVGADVADISMALVAAAQTMKPGADASALLPQAQSMSFGNFKIRFEDSSITNKVLPLIAQMQGTDAQTLKGSASAFAQIGLAQLKSPNFTQQVVTAINAYLADPKSVTVTMKPAKRITIGELMTLNPQDPAAIIALLGVGISAND